MGAKRIKNGKYRFEKLAGVRSLNGPLVWPITDREDFSTANGCLKYFITLSTSEDQDRVIKVLNDFERHWYSQVFKLAAESNKFEKLAISLMKSVERGKECVKRTHVYEDALKKAIRDIIPERYDELNDRAKATMQVEFKQICSICDRVIPFLRYSEKHHLVPILGRSRVGKTILICCDCHDRIHDLFTNKELEESYHTVAALKAHPEVQKWIQLIKNKDKFKFYKKGSL